MAVAKKRPDLARKRPDIGRAAEPPRLAAGPALVVAQAGLYQGDDRLIVAVSVHATDGGPITGLAGPQFKLWQLGQFFGELSVATVVELGNLPTLAGWYHLVVRDWGPIGTGTIPLCVQVVRLGKVSGSGMTAVVKVSPGLP